MGNRIAKHVYNDQNQLTSSTYYMLDAQGHTISTYEHKIDNVGAIIAFEQNEKHIYGSSRLGLTNVKVAMLGTQNNTYSQDYWSHTIGERTYEIANHLGNVLSVISDKPIPHDNGGTLDYYLADLRSSQDYSPFGVTLQDREYALSGAEGYRYGYMGYEGDPEVKGGGNSYTTEFRQYDSRIGRWLSLDPRQEKYANISPFVAFANNPILFIDTKGDTIRLHGEDAGATLIEIQKATSLVLSMDESGRLSATVPEGAELTILDNAILTAIKDEKVNVNLYTTKSEWYNSKDGTGPYPIVVGGMEGSEIINDKVETTQIFNLEMANKLEAEGLDKSGNAAAHEILESYYGGIDNPGGGFEGYESAHEKAEAADDYNPGTTMYQEKHTDTGIIDFGMAKGSKKAKLGDSSSSSKSKIFKKP